MVFICRPTGSYHIAMYSLVTTRAAPSAPSRVVVIGVGHREAVIGQLPLFLVCCALGLWRSGCPGREFLLLYFDDAGGLWDDGCQCRSSGCKLTLLVSFVTILLGSDFDGLGE